MYKDFFSFHLRAGLSQLLAYHRYIIVASVLKAWSHWKLRRSEIGPHRS